MPRAAQEVASTRSRRAQPRAWLRAVTWLVGASLHPRTGATTLAVARDLARRMDYTEGTVLYDLCGTARRLEVSVATVKRHVAYLRQLGALAWARHGSRANLRLPSRLYTATATIYAATIPPVYDHAMGHRVAGTGYSARMIGVTPDGRERAVAEARRTANSRTPSRSSARGREPQSLSPTSHAATDDLGGGLNDTRERAANTPTTTTTNSSSGPGRPQRRRRGRGTGRPPLQVARDCRIAARVRPLVAWTQREGLRRLAYALRPLIDRGLDAHDIATELHSWWLDWRPARPAAYITAVLAQQQGHDQGHGLEEVSPAHPVAPSDSAAWREYQKQVRAKVALEALIATAQVRTDDDRRQARALALYDPQTVTDHIDQHGEDDAIDLFGAELAARAVGLTASAGIRLGRPW